MAKAEQFCAEHSLTEYSALFGRAALIARDPASFGDLTVLSPEEVQALEVERDHKFRGSFWLWYSIVLCAVGAA